MVLVLNGDAHNIDLHFVNETLEDPPLDALLDLFVLDLERDLRSKMFRLINVLLNSN